MALHGEIMVNGHGIAEWSAQRLDDLTTPDQVSLYHCTYYGYGEPTDTHATIEHRYTDGAAVLASLVLLLAEGGWD